MSSPGSPQLPAQEPPGKQQLSFPFPLLTPHVPHLVDGSGSGGGGSAGESSNCNGPDCGVSVTQGAMGPGQYGRGRRPSGQNHGSPINATQGIVVIKYLDNVP